MIRREHRRLDRAFSALLLALAPCVAAQACDRSIPGDTFPNDLDAQAEGSPGDPDDAPATDSKPLFDAGVDARTCSGTVQLHDAGFIDPDADAAADADADADLGCDYAFPCGLPPGLLVIGCEIWVPFPDGGPAAPLGCTVFPGPGGCVEDAFSPDEAGSIAFSCVDCAGGGGRRPVGLRKASAIRSPSARGAYFSRMAYDEAASVHAFFTMREELAFHGAPSSLVKAAERAARDEIRHARLMGVHAHAEGTVVPKARVRRRSAPRSLAAIALENAVEGCVHETFGALLVRWQAAHSADPALRRTVARIAKDEARHAALSWAVASWADRHLDAKARRRISNARLQAMRSLEEKVRAASASDVSLGRPDAAQASALVVGLGVALGLAS